jgi:hypothetical protein
MFLKRKPNTRKEGCLMKNIIHESEIIIKCFTEINLEKIHKQYVLKHPLSIVMAAICLGYKGKTVDFERYSGCHRTTIAYFLNKGKWDESVLEKLKQEKVREKIYGEAIDTGEPLYFIVDDSYSSVTKPSS